MSGLATDPDKVLRHACDRCHSQKLKCPRSAEADDEPCSRCRKADLPCVVSLRGRAGRPCKGSKKRCIETSESSSSLPSSIDQQMSGRPYSSPSDASRRGAGRIAGLSRQVTNSPSMLRDSLPLADSMTNDPLLGTSMNDTGDLSSCFLDDDFGLSSSRIRPPMHLSPSFTDLLQGGNMSDPLQAVTEAQVSAIDQLLWGGQPDEAVDGVDTVSFKRFSSTACYERLSDLNRRILGSLSSLDAVSQSGQMLQHVTGFCGELIDIAQGSISHNVVGISPASSDASSDGRNDTPLTGMEGSASPPSFETRMDNLDQRPWANMWPTAPVVQSVPDSAVTFLLLGCYTQILRLFELSTDSLWAQYCANSALLAEIVSNNNSASSKTTGTLLEAGLAVHTVTYLLQGLNRAFSPASMSDNSLVMLPEDPHVVGNEQTWSRVFFGKRQQEDGLLGHAFDEIREREQRLMKRTQQLRQHLNGRVF